VAPHLEQLGAELTVRVPAALRVKADPACLVLALASIARHVAAPGAQLVIEAAHASPTVTLRVTAATDRLPSERALVFARELLTLIGASLAVGDGVTVSFPAG
jgi:hypothetical protein